MTTQLEDITPVAFGRILERLDQQDRNTLLREAETKEIAMRLAEETKDTAQVLATALKDHIVQDDIQFTLLNNKLDLLLEYQTNQKAGVKVILWLFGAVVAIAGIFTGLR